MNKRIIRDKTEFGFKQLKRLKDKKQRSSVTFHVNKEGVVEKIETKTYF